MELMLDQIDQDKRQLTSQPVAHRWSTETKLRAEKIFEPVANFVKKMQV